MKDQFVAGFSSLGLPNVDLVTAWLPAADYPLLLGVADIGISVHTSTSGLDLPMKAVDMLGSETPVVALRFPALVEMLGGEGQGGMTFSSGEELAEALLALTVNDGAKELREKFSKYGMRFKQSGTWKSEWSSVAWPVIERFIPKRSRQARRRQGSSSELH
jgi:beta-1,4-mannosyltransferase